MLEMLGKPSLCPLVLVMMALDGGVCVEAVLSEIALQVFSELELALASVASELALLAFSELCLMLASEMMVKLMLRQL